MQKRELEFNNREIIYSIVVPCYNSIPFIDRTFAALRDELVTSPDTELVFVDNNSTDGTLAHIQQLIREYDNMKVISSVRSQGVNVARNDGVASSQGHYLLFTDHDDVVGSGWLCAYQSAFNKGAKLVTGPYDVVTPDNHIIQSVEEPVTALWDIPWALGSNSGISRSCFDSIGGFDEQWRGGGDDADFFWRAHFAGLELTFVPGARLTHYTRVSSLAIIKQFFAYGRSSVRLYNIYRERGMPKSSIARASLAMGSAPFELLTSRIGIGSSRRGLERLALHSGRIFESLKLRVCYL